MSVIIRLQNLPWTANALDIRRFFHGLSIPDGGVHIVGGENGDAFIAFSTDEDARKAMLCSGNKVIDTPVHLCLSSKTEMQNVIAQAREAPTGPRVLPPVHVLQQPTPPMYPTTMVATQQQAPPQYTGYPTEPRNMPPHQPAPQPQAYGRPPDQRRPPMPPGPGGMPGAHMQPAPGGYGGPPPGPMGAPNQARHPQGQAPPGSGMAPRPQMNAGPPVQQQWDNKGSSGYRGPPPSHAGPPRDQRDMGYGRDRPTNMPPGSMPPSSGYNQDSGSYENRGMSGYGEREERRDGPPGMGRGPDAGPPHDRSNRGMNGDSISRDDRWSDRERDRTRRSPSPRRQRSPSPRRRRTPPRGRSPSRGSPSRHRSSRYSPRKDHGRSRSPRNRYSPPRRRESPQRRGRDWNERDDRRRDDRREDRRDDRRDGPPRRRSPRPAGDDRRNRYEGGEPFFAFIEGMPLHYNFREVRHYFHGCEIPREGLKLINDRAGNRNGTAYVMFSNESSGRKGLKLSGTYMESNRIEVIPCTKQDFDEAVDSFVPGAQGNPSDYYPARPRAIRTDGAEDKAPAVELCVHLTNLPMRLQRMDIFKFFGQSGINIPPQGLFIEYDDDRNTLGNAYIEFTSSHDYNGALQLHKQLLKGVAIDILPIELDEMRRKIAAHKDLVREYDGNANDDRNGRMKRGYERGGSPPSKRGNNEFEGGMPQENPSYSGYTCVKLKGLPFQANPQMLMEFFDGINIPQSNIYMVFNQRNQSATNGFVEFRSEQDCQRALEYDMKYIGKRYINVTPITKEQMFIDLEDVQKEWEPNAGPPPIGQSGRGGGFAERGGGFAERGGGRGGPGGPAGGRGGGGGPMMRGGGRGGPAGPGAPMGRGMRGGRGAMRGGGPGREGPPRGQPGGPVIGLQNVAFRSSEEDIFNFFEGFEIKSDSIRIRRNEMGQPMGEAAVMARNSEVAQNIIEALQGKPLWGRPVQLYLM